MTWTQTILNIKDASNATQPVIAYTDGTNFSFAHPLLNNTGAIINPATQDTLASILAAAGAIADAAVADPTASASLIAASKGILTDLGQIADAVVAAGATGSMSAKLRRATQGLEDLKSLIVLAAGANTIGNVGLVAGTAKIGATRQDVAVAAASTTTRLANTTAYALGQLISFSTTAATVNASPVAIAAARGTDLPSIARRCRLSKSGTGQTNPYFRVHFWNAAPTVVNGDAGTFSANIANATYCGAFDVNCTRTGSDGSWGAGFSSEGGDMCFTPVSGTSNLYYLLEARGAYTPASGEVFTPYLELV